MTAALVEREGPGSPGVPLDALASRDAGGDGSVAETVLVLDEDAIIRRTCAGEGSPLGAEAPGWVGRAFVDTIHPEGQEGARQLLAEAVSNGLSEPRALGHPGPGGRVVPVAYTVVRLDESGGFLAVGRDTGGVSAMQRRLIETEQAMERDYRRMREAETLYRLLFRMAKEAIFLVDGEALRILDANRAALHLLGISLDHLVGRPVGVGIEPDARGALEELLTTARETGRPGETKCRRASDGAGLRIGAIPFRSEGATRLLIRAVLADGVDPSLESPPSLTALVEHLPDGVALTDALGRIRMVNPAFLDLAQLVSADAAKGRPLGDWVGHQGGDLSMVLAVVKHHGSVRGLPTTLRGEHGHRSEVQLSAALVPGSDAHQIGFIIRGPAQRAAGDGEPISELGAAVQRLTERVGSVSLPELVRDTTELVERHFIEAALALTGGNRTTAADVLGLSRQSLYVKLRRLQEAEAERPATV